MPKVVEFYQFYEKDRATRGASETLTLGTSNFSSLVIFPARPG
jgi:hypothetical protein